MYKEDFKANNIGLIWDKVSERHSQSPYKIGYKKEPYKFYTRFRLYKTFIDKLPCNRRVLEIGCGAGYNLEYLLSSEKGQEAAALDVSSKMLELCKHRLHGWHVDYFHNDFSCFNTNKKYDLILSMQSINYFKDLNVFFKKAYDLMNEKGFLVISDAQICSISFLNRLKQNSLLRTLFNKHKILDIGTSGLYYHNIDQISKAAKDNFFEIKSVHFFGHILFKLTRNFQLYAESNEFKLAWKRKLVTGVYRLISTICLLESKIFKAVNFKNLFYGIILIKVQRH